MAKNINHIAINSVSELHRLMGLPKPLHPLISLINMDEVQSAGKTEELHFILNFYGVSLKKNLSGKLKYGQNYYDFDEGVLAMTAPKQILSVGSEDNYKVSGYWLVFHADFILNYPLGKAIKDYGFFSYAVNEALHLSDKEEKMLEGIFKNIEQEYQTSIDQFSQDVMVSHLELFLNYCNRFYNRQFLTRKKAGNDLLTKMEELLDEYFKNDKHIESGLPTVQYFAGKMNVSSNYLSDMLRTLTGQSTQQHIHNKLIEKAKEALTTTNLSVSEIAYQLGFEHPQSFSKLFKSKTNLTPIEFRASFN
ncbi:helix-turn-helix domain-containing protein [Runella slithyformis]|uniref:Transcriptional regulator, AraC family n=1 Tax=Runella slithyformis (strain ATCC 29530 / DSM 19594 / LMG 11500 / NCIMB 11436 / LSU 4) TaxID=761193 RepID=A0A7U3ZN52_RUNSL|nr:AraC family transcriptional regulator [Runella slithyformis]AEI50262.1 transcriptional regulator, AraC family [Runella slithyformis DSM 19594]